MQHGRARPHSSLGLLWWAQVMQQESSVFAGASGRIPLESILWHRWIHAGGGAGSSPSQLKFGDPNVIVQMTVNSEAACVAGAGGTVAAQPVPALLWWVGIH